MKKVILLSGPPYSGKDTAGRILHELYGGTLDKFSAPMKAAIPALVGIPIWMLEASKDMPMPVLQLPSFRQLQIDMSESWMKLMYGEDVFARLLYYRMQCQGNGLYIVTDCGFQVEVDYIVQAVGVNNCVLVHMERAGCTYAGDSRGPVRGNDISSCTVHNNGTEAELSAKLVELIGWFPEQVKEPVVFAAKEHANARDYDPM